MDEGGETVILDELVKRMTEIETLIVTMGWALEKCIRTGRDFAFPDTNFVNALLAMLSALRLVAGSKHAPCVFGSATWQAGASSDQGIHKTNQNAREVN